MIYVLTMMLRLTHQRVSLLFKVTTLGFGLVCDDGNVAQCLEIGTKLH